MDIYTASTKEIMANSLMEITNPDFNEMVLNKIIKRQKSRLVISHIFLYLLIVAVTAVIVISHTGGLDSFANIILNAIIQLGTWFLTNEFIILPFFILLLIKGVIDIVLYRRVHN
jgi:uncharacterized BrkB/YihY/UPF0761 family membrane protein